MTPTATIVRLLLNGPWGLLGWVALLSALFAQLEIQIEGPHGWAAKLPTWRLPETSPLYRLFGSRPVTGYHVFAFGFMAAVFHLPVFFTDQVSLVLEARILGSLAVFWVLEDFLWFIMNPAYGLSRFRPRHVPWHPHWVLGVPVDYLVGSAAAIALFTYSYWPPAPAPP